MRQRFLILFFLCPFLLSGCQRHRRPGEGATTRPLQAAAPAAAQGSLGSSVEGRSIEMARFGAGTPVVMVIGGIHGDESTGAFVAERLIELLRTSPPAGMKGTVIIIPRANPDGCAAGRRVNAHGVDINRNFPASNWKPSSPGVYHTGPASQSEPETAALISIIEQTRPTLIISIHSIARGRECNNYDGPAERVAAAMSRHNGYPVKPTMGYATPGSLGTWAGIDRQIPIITLELPRQLPAEQAWATNRAALMAAIAESVQGIN